MMTIIEVVEQKEPSVVTQVVETLLELKAPWKFYRSHICEQIAKWCLMCDAEQSTLSSMRVSYPSILRQLSLKDYDDSKSSKQA